jgi:hypothetical protein
MGCGSFADTPGKHVHRNVTSAAPDTLCHKNPAADPAPLTRINMGAARMQ